MHKVLPHLTPGTFPACPRKSVQSLQINLGYYCNQSCVHCHVNAGPNRTEMMTRQTMDEILRVLERYPVQVVDLTGGAPELNPDFRYLVGALRALDVAVIDRCNLTVLLLDGQEDLAEFLHDHRVAIFASLPCYLQDNTDAQRGKGVYQDSLTALRRLNEWGYGKTDGLDLVLVHNPIGTQLPPEQSRLENEYRRRLRTLYGIEFSRLITITNMPIARFGSMLLSQGRFNDYLDTLRHAHQESNIDKVMCRDLISIDWRGFIYDCDFNQMLGLSCQDNGESLHIRDFDKIDWAGRSIRVAEHCYGCTAGSGSSCSGSLSD